MKKVKVGVGLWCVSFASDRFVGGGYKKLPSLEEQIKVVARIAGAESFDLHTSDFAGTTVREVARMAADSGLKINAVNPNVFGDPVFKFGAFSNTDPKVRAKAVDLVKKSIDMAAELRANVTSLWPGQDGFDYIFQNDYSRQWEYTVAAMHEVCDYADRVKGLKICYEYKLREPRMFSMVGSAGMALALVNEVKRKNLGVVLDYGHSLFARENPAQALCLLDRAGKLFNVHFNDAYGAWDDDLMAGSVNVWQNLEFFYYLKESSYDGYVTLDMFPFREDSFEACSVSIRMIKTLESLVERFDRQKIAALQQRNDAPGILEYLRAEVLAK